MSDCNEFDSRDSNIPLHPYKIHFCISPDIEGEHKVQQITMKTLYDYQRTHCVYLNSRCTVLKKSLESSVHCTLVSKNGMDVLPTFHLGFIPPDQVTTKLLPAAVSTKQKLTSNTYYHPNNNVEQQ